MKLPDGRPYVALGDGHFAIGPRPPGGMMLSKALRALRRSGCDLVVSFQTDEERRRIGLDNEAAACVAADLDFRTLPITDHAVPEDPDVALAFADRLAQNIRGGRIAYLHCLAGIGRSATIGCALLVLSGQSLADAIATLSAHRGLDIPETEAQRTWLETHVVPRRAP